MIKTTIFTIVFSHGFVLLPNSPIVVIMTSTSIYNCTSFSFGIANFVLLKTNNVVLILVFHINPPDTITRSKRVRGLIFNRKKLTFFSQRNLLQGL